MHVLQSRLSAGFSMLFAQELRFPFNYTLHIRVHIMILSQYLHTSTDFLMMIFRPSFFFFVFFSVGDEKFWKEVGKKFEKMFGFLWKPYIFLMCVI